MTEKAWTRSVKVSAMPLRDAVGIDTPGWKLCRDCKWHSLFYDPLAADPGDPKEHMCYHEQVWRPLPEQLVMGAHIATRCVDGRTGECGIAAKYFEPVEELEYPTNKPYAPKAAIADEVAEQVKFNRGLTDALAAGYSNSSPPPPTIPWYRRWFSV